MPFDPSAAASPDSGLFGLPTALDQARIVVVPIPFDSTTSYGGGASVGPDAVLTASHQVDLLDHHFGNVFEHGLAMMPIPASIKALSKAARKTAAPIIGRGGADLSRPGDRRAIDKVNAASSQIQKITRAHFAALLAQGKTPALLGGDHATPLGAIQAAAEHVSGLADSGDKAARAGLGILHFDAHMDLRDAFEGFAQSHASIMFNVLRQCPAVTKVVQVGIRDYCEDELNVVKASRGRVEVVFDADVFASVHGLRGAPTLQKLIDRTVAKLPHYVHISFDIDALDPSLCPHTGTPVPGGLSFNLAAAWLAALAKSGRRVVSFDLVEVCPSSDPNAPEWDANVGARLLYKLCGCAGATLPKRGGARGAR